MLGEVWRVRDGAGKNRRGCLFRVRFGPTGHTLIAQISMVLDKHSEADPEPEKHGIRDNDRSAIERPSDVTRPNNYRKDRSI